MNENAKWITDKTFCGLTPKNDVFHKAIKKYTPAHDSSLLNSHILFRKKFTVTEFKKCNIHISADDYYFLYINGQFVCSGPSPAYPWHYYYNDIDISEYVNIGENTIAVHTYYQGLINRVWVSGDYRQGMICQIFCDGCEVLSSDNTFKCARHTAFGVHDIAVKEHRTLFCEVIDSNSKEIGFEKPDFDDSDWQACCEREFVDYTLYRQNTSPLVHYKLVPQQITKTEDGIFIDIGREIIGYLNIVAKGQKDDIVTVRYGEELNDDGTVRYDMRCNCLYEDRWILSGKTDSFRAFDYKGFRYASIIAPQNVTFDDIYVTVRHLPFDCVCNPQFSDSDLSKVWELCKNTIKYASQECFNDCPTREKGQYLGDACISAVAFAILTGNTKPLKKTIVDFSESAKICKGLMAVSTCSFMQEIADFSLCYPLVVLWYYKLTGDLSFIEQILPTVEGILDYFKAFERPDGLLAGVYEKWNLVDWPQNMRDNYDVLTEGEIGDSCHNVINAFYIGAQKCLNKIYTLLNMPTRDITRYEKAFVKEFFREKSGLFADSPSTDHCALHSNALPLLFSIGITDKNKDSIIEFIKKKPITDCGTYFSFYVLHALKQNGQIPSVIQKIKDEGAWLNMLKEGATTTYEAWGKEQKKNTSLCHPWSTCPILILYDI